MFVLILIDANTVINTTAGTYTNTNINISSTAPTSANAHTLMAVNDILLPMLILRVIICRRLKFMLVLLRILTLILRLIRNININTLTNTSSHIHIAIKMFSSTNTNTYLHILMYINIHTDVLKYKYYGTPPIDLPFCFF